ncbi:MAG TPA: outer membrane protein assembly factor BamE [Candidatus Sulfotelmatobacter sp.]|jgi:outer membrane protein assembly factor BamE (lipoprotein component of BamABCDE complex)|nr:outer membrane protein assembly factor BamE [Candidatus Sulfotelmatobacter sp.]
MRSFTTTLLFSAALMGLVTGCTSTIDVRGNVPPPERLAEVKPGKMTKNDVMALLGTPSNTSTFGDDTWYYISSTFETWAFEAPTEIERQVVKIDFDRTGKVTDMQTLGLKDGKEIDLITRETPSPGRDLTILEQFLGNVGRFSKSGKGGGSGS